MAVLAASLLTTGDLISKPAIAISKQSLKQQLLDKILNGTLTDTSDRINNIKSNVQKIKDKILNEVGIRLTKNEEKQVNQEDNKILSSSASASKQSSNCRSGDVLKGASNKKDLKILSKCEEVIGTVKHAKKMNDGDYKFALKVRDKYKFLINKINKKKTGGFLMVEIVPKDQKIKGVIKPKTGDKVDVWGLGLQISQKDGMRSIPLGRFRK